MWIADGWRQYTLIDSGDGERLEKWGNFYLIRPEPQAIWKSPRNNGYWHKPNAVYFRSEKGGGHWEYKTRLPESWVIDQNGLKFKIKPMGFKHMGLFPEQLVNWNWCGGLIKAANRPVKVLNLFAYTGGATVAAAKAGAFVCHVDASKGMVSHARENVVLSGLGEKSVRYIVDDCVKFIEREHRRGNKYDGIIMDPPSYGRGPKGEVWQIEAELFGFVEKCALLLSDNPLFVLLNSYTTGLSAGTMKNILEMTVSKKFKGIVSADEIGLAMSENGLVLPCGSSARWERL
jgi:23S rRNA (cytosine1962-C5)-methyltransferase